MNNSKKPLRNYFNNINEKLRYQILVAKLLRNAFSNWHAYYVPVGI